MSADLMSEMAAIVVTAGESIKDGHPYLLCPNDAESVKVTALLIKSICESMITVCDRELCYLRGKDD